MKPLKICEIQKAVNGNIIRGDAQLKIDNVSTDSRNVKKGDLFIPLKGNKHDAHKFISEAVANGARGIIVDRTPDQDYDLAIIKVKDTNTALQELAHYYRMQFKDLKVVAITGSSGKTTTKDMIAAILKRKYKVLKTEGNLNNYFGLPLSLLKLEGDEDVAVVEMGMSELGEIKMLTEIAAPDIGVITNVGSTHLEFLQTVENVARGKSELISTLPASGIAILNYDNKYVREMAECFQGKKLLYYGLQENADITAEKIEMNIDKYTELFTLDYRGDKKRLEIAKPGRHNIYNALAAIGVARELQMDWANIKAGLMSTDYSQLRQEISSGENFVLINDTYNANPMSMKAALSVLVDIAKKRKVAVLGAMFELGKNKRKAHKEIGQFIVDRGIDVLITVGELAREIARGTKNKQHTIMIYRADNNQEAVKIIREIGEEGDTILVKGSRGNKMEEIVDAVKGQGG